MRAFLRSLNWRFFNYIKLADFDNQDYKTRVSRGQRIIKVVMDIMAAYRGQSPSKAARSRSRRGRRRQKGSYRMSWIELSLGWVVFQILYDRLSRNHN
ncbi:MAG: hypothetical protein AMR96_02945 [Candidatus Adiutrix intracellularis]|nr:MAG: hypothetical protein AMR96_02945 [Candidatus Adiutrix intracellularis]